MEDNREQTQTSEQQDTAAHAPIDAGEPVPENAAASSAEPEDGRAGPIVVEGDDASDEGDELAGDDPEFGPHAPHYLKLPEPDTERRPPAWFPKDMIPNGFRFPRGLDVAFIRIRGHLTAAKQKGDRFAIVWELSDGDEKLAYGRSLNDPNRASGELAKQMLRCVDGHPVKWDGLPGPGNPDRFFAEIGAKGRSQVLRLYTQLHVFDRKEQADFFENCVGVVRTG